MRSKWIILLVIVLIVGLVAGFFGGYYYQASDASTLGGATSATGITVSSDADISSIDFYSEANDESGEFGDEIMKYIGVSIDDAIKDLGGGDTESGLKKLISEDNTTSFMKDINIILPFNKAYAQSIPRLPIPGGVFDKKAPLCSSLAVGNAELKNVNRLRTKLNNNITKWVKDSITSILFFNDNKPNLCVEKASAKISVSFLISKSPDGTQYHVSYTATGNINYTVWKRSNPLAECLPVNMVTPFAKSGAILYNIDSKGDFGPPTYNQDKNTPKNWIKICQENNIAIDIPEIKNPNFNKTECCKNTSQPGPTVPTNPDDL